LADFASIAADTLLEREREVSTLDGLIAAAARGEAPVVSIEGPPGIGKSRLIAHARLRAAEAGFTVLSARGSEFERDFGFGAVLQLFERLVTDDPAPLRRGSAASAQPIFTGSAGGDGAESRGNPSFAALHGLYWLTVHLADERPLLLAVTTCSGATHRRCGSWSTYEAAWRACRCSWSWAYVRTILGRRRR